MKSQFQLKYVYRFICTIILETMASCGFFYVWYSFVKENNQTGHLMGLGNLGMSFLIYVFLFFLVGKWFHAFYIGIERKAMVIAGIVITLFTVNTIEVFISMAITGQFRFFISFLWRYYLLAICQSFLLGIITVIMVNIYRSIIPPLSVLEIVGDYHNQLYDKINAIKYKYEIKETVNYSNYDESIREKMTNYDAVLINDVPAQIENLLVKTCFDLDKRVYIVPKISDIIVKSSDELNVVDTPLFLCRNLGISLWQSVIKRTLDIILSICALIIFSPILLLTALAIKIEDHGPVFFKQERVTINGKRFMILKFRSMIVDAEKDGRPHPAGEKDDRITKVGNLIRTLRIDELPQIINILKGDMSIVGPRPERWEHVEQYTKEIIEFPFRLKMKGGLTGYAQVYGKYNTTALDKLKLDMIYITNYSLSLDIQILFETLKILFQKESTEGFTEERSKELHDSIE